MNLSKDKKIQTLAGLFFLAIFLLLPGRSLFQYGMFIDGVFYSNIARDFAQEGSSLWLLEISQGTGSGAFYSHPPLVFWLHSVLFSIFGDQFWVDRLYGLCCLLLSVFFAFKILKLLLPASTAIFCLPVLYLVLPQVSWAYANNLLENTVNVFALLAVYGHLQAMLHRRWLWGGVAILATVAATLAKGPPGLFPLAVPMLVQLSLRPMKWGYALAWQLIQLLGFVGCWALLLCDEGASLYLSQYLSIQLQPSLAGDLQVADHRWGLLLELAWQLLPLAALGGLLWLLNKQMANHKIALLLVGIGLSASLPLLISPKQMGFYILPSLIYFVMAFIAFFEKQCSQGLNIILQRSYWRISLSLSILLIITGIIIISVNYKTYHRDAQELEDIQALKQQIIPGEQIGVSKDLHEEWSLFAYLYRNYKVSIALDEGETRYFIVKDKEKPPKVYSELLHNGKVYDFYKKE